MTTLSSPVGTDLQPIDVPAPRIPSSDRWQVHVYAHTHWDREWYRSFERFRMQLVGAVDRILDTLESDPSFTTYVLDGQTIVLDDASGTKIEVSVRSNAGDVNSGHARPSASA